jgi:hypothetical protein
MRLTFAAIRPPLRSADFGVQLSLWDAERGQLVAWLRVLYGRRRSQR